MRKHIYIILTLLLFFGMGTLSGQNSVSDLYLNAGTNDLSVIQKRVNDYFEGRDKGRGTGFKQWKRWEYLAERHLTPDGKVENWAARNWQEYQNYQAAHPQTNGDNPDTWGGFWHSCGIIDWVDGNGYNGGIGRINCIAFHPTNSSIYWVGAPSGGLWKTTTGGDSWTPLTDGMPVIGVSGIAVNYNNTNEMYILTGDGDGGDTYSIGVLKTTDGGETWNATGLTYTIYNNIKGYKLLMHPTNPAILFVVSTDGVFKTTNSGVTWTEVLNGSFRDIEFKPGDPTVVYVSGGTTFHRSTDSGVTWTQITTGVPSTASRVAIGVTPANSSYVYLLTGPATGTGSFKGVYRSTNSGVSFSTQSTTPNILGYSNVGNDADHQTTYDLAVAVSRTNASVLMTGGINTWVSSDGGATWTCTSVWNNLPGTAYTHADIHALDINPLNNYIYCGSDGGIFRSTAFSSSWADMSTGLSHTQWYRIAGYEPDVNLIIGGTQDNGSNKWTGGTTMLHVLGADGMDCMIDNANPSILYNTQQYGDVFKSTNGGASYSRVTPSGASGSWVTPFIMNPSNSSIIYGGYSDVYKSTNGGSTWTNCGVDGRGAMAMGTNNTSRIYASYGSTIYMSNDAGSTWTNISAGLPAITISFIAVNPDYSLDVYVTLSGYSAGQKVYYSHDAGTTWTNVSGSLPNVPANCIVFQDNNGAPDQAVYVGTDIGVFYRNATLTDWQPYRNGLPTVPVFDMEINYTSGYLTAGTYGRGLWRSNLYDPCPWGWTLNPGNDPSNPNYTGVQFYEASNWITSSRVVTGGIGTDVKYKSANSITLTTGFHAKEHNLFQATLGPCSTGAPGPLKPNRITGIFTGKTITQE